MHTMRRVAHTPILILLHARYQRFQADMSPFLVWRDDTKEWRRTLLLVDELPDMIDTQALDTQKLNALDSELTQLYPSHNPHLSRLKEYVHIRFSCDMIQPYNRLRGVIQQKRYREHRPHGILTWQELKQAGFDMQKLECLRRALVDYLPPGAHPTLDIVDLLLNQQAFFYAIGKDIQLYLGQIDDCSWVWLNGTFLGEISDKTHPENYWLVERKYTLSPRLLKKKGNTLIVLCRDLRGNGGILGTPRLIFGSSEINLYADIPEIQDDPYRYFHW